MSIPVTMRTLIKKCQGQNSTKMVSMQAEPPDINISLISSSGIENGGKFKFSNFDPSKDIKSEPMDFEASAEIKNESLNTSGPRDAAFNPEVRNCQLKFFSSIEYLN